jgi:hypothetical protein
LITSTSVEVLSEQMKVHKLIQLPNIWQDSLPTRVFEVGEENLKSKHPHRLVNTMLETLGVANVVLV